ncbi:HAD family hydrolase [[Clostridium] fimetarium]|uniref:Cof subfamily of IIB subfamily of haloacid dehalogenase superfamily/HAD-superfamily hydrolase, subfamily IIB n=1 Tax=[Clostridium] fimetarium TaxID=99656 RepID=A0A1I0R2P4_9FIRM|nr:HAD family hydrolase [[Clostridium] fimetarium]SEW34160.1 hypothetical protein SAMN05421659_11110 [[Clostridium] fimetarium]
MKTLYVTDLDGTLLNTQDKISEYSLKVINDLVEKGLLFTYATARSLVSASVVTKGLSTKIPVIAYNGAFIIDPSSGTILSSNFFDNEEKQYIIDVLEKFDIFPLVYAFIDEIEKVSWMQNKENEGIRRYLSGRQWDKRMNILRNLDDLYKGNIFYFTCIGEKEELLPIYNLLSQNEHYNCTLQQELYREEYWCEIMPRAATKANAINKLKTIWKCDKVISFGDAINDIPMFTISNECYAVSNAVPELKALATQIIPSNDADAVANWLLTNHRI